MSCQIGTVRRAASVVQHPGVARLRRQRVMAAHIGCKA